MSPMSSVSLCTSHHDNAVFHQWLQERQTCMVLFNRLCHLRPFSESNQEEVQTVLLAFSHRLIEYVSWGHFKIFEHIVATTAVNKDPAANVSQSLMSTLFTTTYHFLDFYDKYHQQASLINLEEDLALLGKAFAQRLEGEDMLIKKFALTKNLIRHTRVG